MSRERLRVPSDEDLRCASAPLLQLQTESRGERTLQDDCNYVYDPGTQRPRFPPVKKLAPNVVYRRACQLRWNAVASLNKMVVTMR